MSVPKNNIYIKIFHIKSYLECFGNLAKIKAEMTDSCYNNVGNNY
jgi:hypothetical protein